MTEETQISITSQRRLSNWQSFLAGFGSWPGLWALFKKELSAYFNSPIAYIFISSFLVAGNWLFFKNFFIAGQVSMRGYFELLPWIFMFLTPAITMRLWAEEKKSGTIEFLLTLPVTDLQVVMAKFLASLSFLAFNLLLTASIPLSIARLGDIDVGPVIGGYLGALLLGSAYLSLGLAVSSLTKNQIIAFILSLLGSFIFFIIGTDFVATGLPDFMIPILRYLGLGSHFQNIARGVIDSADLFYYFSFVFFWLWLNAKIIAGRAWK